MATFGSTSNIPLNSSSQQNSLIPTSTIPSLNQPLTFKLDDHNYLIWKNQLPNVIIANGLEEFIDGSRICPPKFLDNQTQVVNPEYSTWQRYNCLLMSWFYASLIEGIMTQMVNYSTTIEIWQSLTSLYSATSMAKLTELRSQFQTLKKDGLTAISYINKLKSLCNSLVAIGEPVSYNDHVIYLLGGLGCEYNLLVTLVINQPDKPSVAEIYSLFLSYEFFLDTQTSSDQLTSLQVHFTQLHPNQKSQR